jgi:hypothetical protein
VECADETRGLEGGRGPQARHGTLLGLGGGGQQVAWAGYGRRLGGAVAVLGRARRADGCGGEGEVRLEAETRWRGAWG